MSLSDMTVRSLRPRATPYKRGDSYGLYLLVKPSGGKLWRFDYRYGGKRKTLALGEYPRKSLADARRARDDARALLDQSIDPSERRRLDKLAIIVSTATTFEVVANEWLTKIEKEGRAEATLIKSRWFVSLLLPSIGNRPIAAITPPELLLAMRKIEAKGRYESARRARSTSSRIFRYAIATGRSERNPAGDLAGALITPRVSHYSSVIEPEAIGELLRAIDSYRGSAIVSIALRLLPLVFVRPIELRHAQWRDVDLAAARWTIPASIMKMRRPHVVPLSRQAIQIIESLRPLTGEGRYLFPSLRTADRAISENTLNAALRRLGYTGDDMTSHGFRSMASTRLNEMNRWNPDAIERQLAHGEKDVVRGSYNRAEHLAERIEMIKAWSDYLDELRAHGS